MKKILSILLAGAMLAGCVLTGCSDSSSSKSDSSDGNTAKVADPIEGVKATASTDKYRNYYEIFVNSFCDSNGDETGDLQGIISQLDYLNDGDPNSGDDLGVDAIWLTPIMPSKSYHKYDVEDYYNIDPDFGTLDDFDKLIEECHKRGINVILDLVLNHASSKNPLFTKAVEEVADNKLDGNAEYFEIHSASYFDSDTQTISLGNGYACEANFSQEMPEWNLNSKKTREEFTKIAKFWLDRGVDGFRLDACKYFTNKETDGTEFLKWFYDTCKGIKKDVYHCNEGHAALCNVQRLCDYVESGLTFDQALEVVRSSSLYTVHTPVPAGHDYFDEGLFGKYMGGYPQRMGISWQDLMDLGRINPGDAGERFCMSTFACNTCQEVNGVSWLHGKVSQEMFSGIWKGYFPEESHVGYVTNGVHFPTWSATEWKKLYAKHFAPNFLEDQSNEKIWEAIYNVADEEIWETRMALKHKLVDHIRKQFSESWLKNQGDPSRIVSLMEKINPNALLIGFARRFATYKRAHLLFTDLERLSKIVNNPDYPVQFLFAGKAHPHDGAGQGLIKKIVEISRRPEFLGKIIFLENYDMQLARRLVSGVDIWLNTPTRPLEASGTSGEKALMNGVVNFSVLDGWWLEGYREGAGWALTEKRTYQNQEHQDQLDAATIYSILEQEILPLFYARNKKGYSEGWVKTIKNSIAQIAPHYTMKRQLDDYYDKFYIKEAKRFKMLAADGCAKAKEIAAWKEEVAEKWDSIEVVSCEKTEDLVKGSIESGKEYTITYVIDEKGLNDAIGLELVTTYTAQDGKQHVYSVEPFNVVKKEGNLYTFQAKHKMENAGSFKVSYRMFPKNADLPHRQDFCYVRWFV